MALPTISTTDFTGFFKISANQFRDDEFADYLSRFYPEVVEMLIGSGALEEIEGTDPLPQKYTDLFNGVYYTNVLENLRMRSGSLLEVCKAILYAKFVVDDFDPSSVGNTKGHYETAERDSIESNNRTVANRYNYGIDIFNARIVPFLENYIDFEGEIQSITDAGGGNYTVASSDTGYLIDGDTVKIAGLDYIVSGLIANTSFVIAGDGLPVATKYVYNPFALITDKVLELKPYMVA